MLVEVDIVTSHHAACLNDWADIFWPGIFILRGCVVFKAAAEGFILFGRHCVALASEGVPDLSVLGDTVSPQHKEALAVGKGLAHQQPRLNIVPSLRAVDVVEIVAEKDAVVLAHLHIEKFVAAHVELFCSFEQLAVPLAGDQRHKPSAAFDEAGSPSFASEFGGRDVVTEVPADEEALSIGVVEPHPYVPLSVEFIEPVAAPL